MLIDVTEARAKASSVKVTRRPADRSRPRCSNFGAAQGALSQSLGRLLVTVEKYPDLKSNQNFLALQSQLEGTENRITIARRDYNSAVQAYNTRIRTFPDAIGAKIDLRRQADGAVPGDDGQCANAAPTVSF